MGSKRKRLTFLVPAMYVCGLLLMGVNLIPAMRRKSSGQNAHNAGGGGGELGRGIDHLASAAAKQPVSLAIAINTLPRSGGANYLLRALRSIEAQRKPLGRTAVYVMNVQPGEHSVFDEARREFDQLEYGSDDILNISIGLKYDFATLETPPGQSRWSVNETSRTAGGTSSTDNTGAIAD